MVIPIYNVVFNLLLWNVKPCIQIVKRWNENYNKQLSVRKHEFKCPCVTNVIQVFYKAKLYLLYIW